MNPGGGHERNNPRLGKKSKFRGDKQREKKAGRKRLDREYRRKGSRETPLETEKSVFKEFNDLEYNIIYNLDKKKAYGRNSVDLVKIIRARKVPPRDIMTALSEFVEKLSERNWGRVYSGVDGKIYVSLNIEKKIFIEQYIELKRP